MNVKVLIDNIVRQTTVLIAQLATSAGLRAPLAHIANQVFLSLVKEIESQGVRRKVIADMFGLALRSYQLKVHRLEESLTDRNRSLWEAVFDYLREGGVVSRADILRRFRNDDEATLRGILRDLVDSGLIFKTGKGNAVRYRAATDQELGEGSNELPVESTVALVWIAVYRMAPTTQSTLVAELGLADDQVRDALATLVRDGRVERVEPDPPDGGADTTYRCDTCVIPIESPVGWEAALFDHFQAMVNAISVKLEQGRAQSLPSDIIGGSTYSFDIWPGHPHEEQVLGLLRRQRSEISALRSQVTTFNQKQDEATKAVPGAGRVTFYLGQSYRSEDMNDD